MGEFLFFRLFAARCGGLAKLRAMLFAFHCASCVYGTEGAMMASPFLLARHPAAEVPVREKRSDGGFCSISIWFHLGSGRLASDEDSNLRFARRIAIGLSAMTARLFPLTADNIARSPTIATSFRFKRRECRRRQKAASPFRFARRTSWWGYRPQHGLFFGPLRLYLHRGNGSGLKRLRDGLFTAGGMRDELIGARRNAFEGFSGCGWRTDERALEIASCGKQWRSE